jgi:O-antigen ligase
MTAIVTRAPQSTSSWVPRRSYGASSWEPHATRAWLRPEWPIAAICAGMPLAFLIGVHGFVWILPALVFGPQLLLRREPILIPRSAIPLLLLVAWIPVTMLQLPLGKFPLATFRLLVFASTLVCLLWLVNETEERVSSARIVRLLSILWIVLIAFGYLAIALPHFSMPSPIQRVAPGALFSNSYIRDLGRWNFAQVQSLVTDEVSRPAAPMAYSNGWGSTLGLLTPFFVLDFFILGSARRRRWGAAVAIIGLVPIIMSLNRGLWLSVGVAFAYVALRRALQGNVKLVITIALAGLFIFGTLAVTTLGNTVQQRFEIASESNSARSALYEVAFDAMKSRPLVGYGAPIDGGLWRDVGTHGLVWFVMVAYGLPGFILLLLWMIAVFLATLPAPNPIALWSHVAIIVFIVQVPIYGLQPQLALVGIAAGLGIRAQAAHARKPKSVPRPLEWAA